MGVAESFQTQPSSHQIRLPRDSEYINQISFGVKNINRNKITRIAAVGIKLAINPEIVPIVQLTHVGEVKRVWDHVNLNFQILLHSEAYLRY